MIDMSFSGSPYDVFPVPRLESVIWLDDEEVLRTEQRLPQCRKNNCEKLS